MSSDLTNGTAEGLSDFFHYVWENTEGFVYLPTLDRSQGPVAGWRSVFFKWPLHKKAIIQHVMSGTAKGLEVYYSPAIYKGESPDKPGKPEKSNVLGTHVLWSEFDGDAPHYWQTGPDGAPGEPSEAASGAGRAVPEPTLRVQSSADGHEHVYWKLEDFQTDKKWVEEKNRAITYSYRADTSGWDVTQILRPPYTTNYKRDLPVTIINKSDERIPVGSFNGLTPPIQIVNESINIEELPPVEGIIATYAWDIDTFQMFMDPHIPEGNRSSALMRLGYFCAEVGMTDTEAYAILYNADERWGKYKGRRDQKRRLIDIIDRARQKHPRALKDLTFAGLLEGPVEEGRELIYGFKDFMESKVEVTWAVEGLIEVGGYGMITSMPGVGKTQMSIQLGMACALGTDFLRWKVPKPQKIVLLSLEMSHVGLKIFFENIAPAYTQEEHNKLQDNFIIVPIGEAISLDKPQGMKFIESIMDEVQPDGIIIDSIGKLSLEDLSGKTAKNLNDRFAHLRNKYQCFLWFIHHNRKASGDNKKPTDLSDVYGDVYITTDMSAILTLWKSGDGIEVIQNKSRYAPVAIPFTVTRTENLTFEMHGDAPFGLGDKSEPDDKPEPRSDDKPFSF